MSILKGNSPFKHVLNTNYSASTEESHSIGGMLKESKQVLDGMDKDIVRLRTEMHQRIARRNKLAAIMDAHRALVSPIRRLSPELLSEIFIHCLSEDHNPVRSINEAPLLLTRICRSWRETALGDPRLWKSLHIHIPYLFSDESITKIVAQRSLGMKNWLSKSGKLPISLSFCATYIDYPCHHSSDIPARATEPPVYSDFMHTMLQPEFFSRWRHLDLKFSSSVLNNWVSLKGQGLSSLRTLKLDFGDDLYWALPTVERPQDFSLADLISEAPNLRVFSLSNYVRNPYNLPLRWENLTELTLKSFCHSPEGLTIQQVLYILGRASQSLQTGSFCVSFPIPYINLSEEQEIINLPVLRSLEIKFTIYSSQTISTRISEKEVGNFFNYIHAPSLTGLGVQVTCGLSNVMNSMTSMPFLPLLKRSSCNLHSLSIELPITDSALLEFLPLAPDLVSLSITECRWNQLPIVVQLDLGPMATFSNNPAGNGESVVCDELLRLLTIDLTGIDMPLCPRLEKLRLARCGPLSGDAVINLAKSRWNVDQEETSSRNIPTGEDRKPTRLKVLEISLSANNPEDIKAVKKIAPELQTLKQQGMKITLSYPPERRRTGKDSPWTGLPTNDPRRVRSPFDRLF
ncbi:hypothetical protein K435DRAFT_716733 [Dendrothele bispora CBS 962.96]|uniref:F-box domain-containing protein n=1 Tax=Dendrothele bispora (strain CBS 962.96) TaxID=1314807 RepID=A0A4S8MIN8_DENBC|nr:hypothetical protein K435DRAFT_716733 [Dendrothele bispora CBS 962.96]